MAPGRERAKAIAWVSERTGALDDSTDLWGPQHEMYALAVFDVHVEYHVDGGWQFQDGPRGVALDEALTWAQARAAQVAVQWLGPDGSVVSSAGEAPIDGAPVWEGPTLAPRRIPGWEHLDRSDEDDPISWEVISRAVVMPVEDGFAEALADGLRAVPDVEVVAVKADPAALPEDEGEFVWTDDVAVHLRLTARTYDEACRRAADVCAEVAGRCAPASHQNWPADGAEAYPTGSRAAENADVHRRGYSF